MNQLHVCQGGDVCAVTDLDVISRHLETPETVVWLDLESPGETEIALLQREFNVHPWRSKTRCATMNAPRSSATPITTC